MTNPIRWSVGQAVIESLIAEGRLKRRPSFNPDLNREAFDALTIKQRSIAALIEIGDYESAVILAHEVIRKALTCLLHQQGLSLDDIAGSHRTVEQAALAQFGEKGGPLYELASDIRDIRMLRHDGAYRSEITDISRDDAEDAASTVADVLHVVGRLMPYLGVFT